MIKPEHSWLTAFVTDYGVFEWIRMPFGLKCASNSFLRAVQQIIKPIREFNDSYVDDIATFSNDWDYIYSIFTHFSQKCVSLGWPWNWKNVNLLVPRSRLSDISLGLVDIVPTQTKWLASKSMVPPTNKREVRQMLGFFPILGPTLTNLQMYHDLSQNWQKSRFRIRSSGCQSTSKLLMSSKNVYVKLPNFMSWYLVSHVGSWLMPHVWLSDVVWSSGQTQVKRNP